MEWDYIFKESQKQAIIGILAEGVFHLPNAQRPQQEILLQWLGMCQQIEIQNQVTTQTCIHVCNRFEEDGFNVCILKGQSNYRYYPTNMQNRRVPGDVDIWMSPKGESRHPTRAVLNYIKDNHNMNGLCWLHASHQEKNGVLVETHFRASFMNNPCNNRRFQMHFSNVEKCRLKSGYGIPALKVDEDVIYQMNHIYRHLIDEGVGVRQIVDYYYVLNSWDMQRSRSNKDTMQLVSDLGMKKFAGALMYVLRELCGMPERLLLCPAVENEGKVLLNEIFSTGNFGNGDSPTVELHGKSNRLCSQIYRALRRIKRNMRFLNSYPDEVIWEPIARIWHFIWKKMRFWQFE